MRGFSEVPIADVREYWNARPCNIRHSPRELGTREYFDEVEARKYFVEPHIPAFAEFARWRGRRVLEIGCGIGTESINFARHGAYVTAVDVSENSLDMARRRAQVYGYEDRIQFRCGDAERLTSFVPVEAYDLIFSFGVLHHTPHPEGVVEQIRHYVAPETVVKIMLYHRHSWKVLWMLLKYGKGRFWRLDELVARYSEAQTGCPVTYCYSRPEARELLRGFEITEMAVRHIFPYRVADYVQYRYVKMWYFRWMPAALFDWMQRRFGWHLCITAIVPDVGFGTFRAGT